MAQTLSAVIQLKDEFSSKMQSASDSLGDFVQKTDSSGSAVGDLKSSMGTAAKGAAAFGAAVGAAGVAAGGAIMGMGADFANTADEIDKASIRAGVGAESLQELEFWAGQVGVSESALQKTLERTNQRMGEAEAGNESYQSALDDMNVALKDSEGNMRDTDDVFKDAIHSLSDIEDSQERAALAGEFFGDRTSRKLLPAIEAGGDKLDELTDSASDYGAVIEDNAVDAGVLFNDTLDKGRNILSGFWNEIASRALPYAQQFMDFFMEHAPEMRETFGGAVERVGNVLVWVGEKGYEAFQSVKEAVEDNEPTIERLRDTAEEIGEFFVDAFEEAEPAIDWLIEEGLPNTVDYLADVVDGAIDLYETVTDNWTMIEPVVFGIAGAFAALRAVTVAQTAATIAATVAQRGLNLAMMMNPLGAVIALIGILVGVGISLYRNWDTVREKAGELWDTISETWDSLKESTKETWEDVKERVSDAMDEGRRRVRRFFSPLLDFIDDARDRWNEFTSILDNFEMPSIGMPEFMGGDGLIQTDGSHRTGLDKVPRDGYIANLHKDEAVLPRREANQYRKQGLQYEAPKQTKTNASPATQKTEHNSKSVHIENITVNSNGSNAKDQADELAKELEKRLANMA
ncbi:hypothetical protein [Salsuginibacillus kocurii]|uniref:hypothetical protein n=1 Tax=Salsuginibacillus kocurii TaxID=427078 RepID=UPI0003638EBD|nr:hypothetical protein [Salsuginibacillus kocurii]